MHVTNSGSVTGSAADEGGYRLVVGDMEINGLSAVILILTPVTSDLHDLDQVGLD